MKIIFITTQNPYISKGGLALYSKQIIESLKLSFSHAEIQVVAIVDEGIKGTRINEVENNIFINEVCAGKKNKIELALSVFRRKSFNSLRYLSKYKKYESDINDADLLILNHRLALGAFDLLNFDIFNGKLIYINHNDEFSSISSMAEYIRNPIVAKLSLLEADKVFKEEIEVMKAADAVTFINSDDSFIYHSALNNRVKVKSATIPVYINIVSTDLNNSHTKNLLLVGSFDWLPKKLNAEWLSNEVFPIVLKASPDSRLIIVGRSADKLEIDNNSVDVYSDVSDINSYYGKANIFAIPEKQTGGLKIKSVEAASKGMAIVSTKSGVSGSMLKDGYECIVCDMETSEFAEALISLIENPKKAKIMGKSAMKKVDYYFSDKTVKNKWSKFWSELYE
jgi:glycosyltransferase involved in cell wall biosynthesis|tara:strand:+ start:102 stop:1286 length:1185 start_codon:yes stop_codon:yes gene_type:complete